MTDQTTPKSIFLTPPSSITSDTFLPRIARIVAMQASVMCLQAIEHIEIDHNGNDHECDVHELLESLATIYSQAKDILKANNKSVPEMGEAIDEYINHLFSELSEHDEEVEIITRKIAWLKSNKTQICEKFKQAQKAQRDPNDLPISMMLDFTANIARLTQQ